MRVNKETKHTTMLTTQDLLDQIKSIKTDCASLLVTAVNLSHSPDPAQRALAYEINLNVSKIMSEQMGILSKIQEIEEVVPGNGYGALVD